MLRTASLVCAIFWMAQAALFAAPPAAFGVAAHDNVNIEWWYVNAHVTTNRGRHLALIGSFFRFGNGRSPFDNTTPAPRAHYLIYAVTDLDKKTQRAYSLGDGAMVAYLKQVAPLLAVQNPHDRGAQELLAALNKGTLPAPHKQILGTASVVNSPFRLAYGMSGLLSATNAANTEFALDLGGGRSDTLHLTLASRKAAMAVGGTGETGLRKKNDMYYFSLTRCAVQGTVDTGSGPETITGGDGWFDHQWGNSWVASNNGWDWWGVQLTNGTDILFFRQRDLKTGKIFFPLATFMDKDGHQTVTKNIIFTPYKKSLWKSPKTGVAYPLAWQIDFPDKNLHLEIAAAVKNQEMPILGPGSGIWEGSCTVVAQPYRLRSTSPLLPAGKGVGKYFEPLATGTAYMELVGYASPAVKAQMRK